MTRTQNPLTSAAPAPVPAPAPPGDNTPPPAGQLQWGLKLPGGFVVWPPAAYKDRPVETPADRAALLEALRATAADLGFPQEAFLAHYGWVSRLVYENPHSAPVDDPEALAGAPLPASGETPAAG